MKVFKLDKPQITLAQFLKATDYITSGGEAKYFLLEDVVIVNGERCLQRGKKLQGRDMVSVGLDNYVLSYD